jgi:hypothetical protein
MTPCVTAREIATTLKNPDIRKAINPREAKAYEKWAAGNSSFEEIASFLGLRHGKDFTKYYLTDIENHILKQAIFLGVKAGPASESAPTRSAVADQFEFEKDQTREAQERVEYAESKGKDIESDSE